MKSFVKWVHEQPTIKVSLEETYNAGITEGIAEGRRLQLSEMRCESCAYNKGGICWSNKNKNCNWITPTQHFGCIHHERRNK